MQRYTELEIAVIEKYFEQLRWTRKTGKISESIRNKELAYWEKFEPKVVIEALKTHMEKYPTMREEYTRGIIRNIDRSKGDRNNEWENSGAVNKRNESSEKKASSRNEAAADAIRARLGQI